MRQSSTDSKIPSSSLEALATLPPEQQKQALADEMIATFAKKELGTSFEEKSSLDH